MRFKPLALIFTAGVLATTFGALPSIQAGPTGDSLVINSYLAGDQYLTSAVAASLNGDKLFLWNDPARSSSYLQRYDSTGRALASREVELGYVADQVAVDRVGNYAITRTATDGSEEGVFVTLYDRAGNIRVNTFVVNDNLVGRQLGAGIGMNGNGNFAAAYMSYESGKWNTYLRPYHANGSPRGPSIKLNVSTAATLYVGSLAIDASGNIVVSGTAVQGVEADVWMLRVSASGALLGAPLTVNTYTVGSQAGGYVAMDSSSNFIVVWDSAYQDGNGWTVYGQRFNPDGSRFGGPFRISQTLSDPGAQPGAKVGVMDDGSFAVTWYVDRRSSAPGTLPVVYTREFRANLTPVAAETAASTIPGSMAFFPLLAMDAAGNYTIGWRDYNSSGNYDVAVRRHVMETLPQITTLSNGQVVSGLAGATASWRYFKLNVPSGATTLNVVMSGPSSGDGDLYIRFGALPTLSRWDIRPYLNGNNESVSISNPPSGDFYIGIYGYNSYASISLTATYY